MGDDVSEIGQFAGGGIVWMVSGEVLVCGASALMVGEGLEGACGSFCVGGCRCYESTIDEKLTTNKLKLTTIKIKGWGWVNI